MIGCNHVSGLEVRPYRRRGPVWRCADQVQITLASAKAQCERMRFLVSTRPIGLPLPFFDLSHRPTHQR